MMILIALSVFNCSENIFLNIKKKIDGIYYIDIETAMKMVHIIVYFSLIKECC